MTTKEKYDYIYQVIFPFAYVHEEDTNNIMIGYVIEWREENYPKSISLNRDNGSDFSNWVLDLCSNRMYKTKPLLQNPSYTIDTVYSMILEVI